MMRTPPLLLRLLALGLLVLWGCESEPTRLDFTVVPGEHELEVGSAIQLSPVGAPGPVHWSSSNSSVATVIPETGYVTAVSRGEALVTAVSGRHWASARVVVRDPPAIGLSRPAVDFEATRGDDDPLSSSIDVTNDGDGALEGLRIDAVEHGEGQEEGWLDASLSSSTAPASLVLEARPERLPAGVHSAVVLVGAPGVQNSPQALSVTLAVLEPARIVLSDSEVELTGIPDRSLTAVVGVTNGGDRPLVELDVEVLAGDPWLSAELDGPDAPAQLALTANTGGLDTGEYPGRVRVASRVEGVEAVELPVTLRVTPGPAIGLSPASVSMSTLAGGSPGPAQVQVTNAGGGTLSDLSVGTIQYGAGQPAGWLAASLAEPEAPTTLTLTAAAASLPAGTFTAQVPVLSPVASNSPRAVQVTLTVGEPPQLAVSPSSLTFSAPRQGPNPSMQLVNVTNAGGGVLGGLSAHVTYTGGGAAGWLTTAWEAGSTTAPTRLEVRPQTGGLAVGTYTADVEIRSSVEGVQPRTVQVTFHVLRSFGADVWPILSSSAAGPCSNCHVSGTLNFSNQSTAYSGLILGGHVIPGDPEASLLMCVLDHDDGCQAMPRFADRLPLLQRNIVRQWIEQGARP